MREIKFRGKSALDYDNKWIYGGILYFCGRPQITYETDCFVSRIGIIPETLGQYTGLKDKNGVEVYEGDILSRNDAQFPMRGPVEYENGGFYFHDEELGFCQYLLPDIAKRGVLKELEVVGNIHDDAGLLTPKDN